MLSRIAGHTMVTRSLTPDSVVLDLGANEGHFSHSIIDQFRCRCVAVEANPGCCERIEPHPLLQVHCLAIAGAAGRIPLRIMQNSESSTILIDARRNGVAESRVIEVNAKTLETFCRDAGLVRIDAIKFDIEGAEVQVIDACPDLFLQQLPQLTVEFHDFVGLTPAPVIRRVIRRLRGLGFTAIKMARHTYGDTLFINRRLDVAGGLECLWARLVTRNWWGLKRIMERIGQQPTRPSNCPDNDPDPRRP